MSNGTKGEPVQIISVNADHTFTLNEDALKKILERDDTKNLPVAVISIAGAFRKGKSFMLSFFIRYLAMKGSSDWFGDEDAPLEGFHWRGGCDADTSGILMWSEPFVVDAPVEGGKVAVLLMDTQGTFDSETTLSQCATIFALSTMVSSVQIYNISQNIQENDLQNLQLFTEYGKLAIDGGEGPPFQKLQFLVRDWMSPTEHPFGAAGGKALQAKRLKIDPKAAELKKVRGHLKSCFSEIDCFLMPHPGLTVSENKNYDGRLNVLREEFKPLLDEFVKIILAKENLVVKEIGGQQVKVNDLKFFFCTYMNLFKNGKIPEVKSMVRATADANNQAAVAKVEDLYRSEARAIFAGGKSFWDEKSMLESHMRLKTRVMDDFMKAPKFGGNEYTEPYITVLQESLERLYLEELIRPNEQLQATIKANVRSARMAAENFYRAEMQKLRENQQFCEETELRDEHSKKKSAALEQFMQTEDIGDEHFVRSHLTQLTQNLDDLFREEVIANEAAKKLIESNNRSAVAEGMGEYHRRMMSMFEEGQPLLKADVLNEKHRKLKKEILSQFQQLPNIGPYDLIKFHLHKLEEQIESALPEYVRRNKDEWVNHEAIVKNALFEEKDKYRARMKKLIQPDGSSDENELLAAHEKLMAQAKEMLKQMPNISDTHYYQLDESLENEYNLILAENRAARKNAEVKLKAAVAKAKEHCRLKMMNVLEDTKPLLDSDQLNYQYDVIKNEALERFVEEVEAGEESQKKLSELLDGLCPEFLARNDSKRSLATELNEAGVYRFKEQYKSGMTSSLLGAKPLGEQEIRQVHQEHKRKAVESFLQEVRTGGREFSKTFVSRLENEIETAYGELEKLNSSALTTKTKSHNFEATSAAKKEYARRMEACFERQNRYCEDHELRTAQKRAKEEALEFFKAQPDIGDEKVWRPFAASLEKDLDGLFKDYVAQNNEAKRSAKSKAELEVGSARDVYQTQMRTALTGSQKYLEQLELQNLHDLKKRAALQQLATNVAQNEELLNSSQQQLKMEIESVFLEMEKLNTKLRSEAESIAILNAHNKAKRGYKSAMQQQSASSKDAASLKTAHLKCKSQAMEDFEEEISKLEAKGNHLSKLEGQLDASFNEFEQLREMREREELEEAKRLAEEKSAAEESEHNTVIGAVLSAPFKVIGGVATGLEKIFKKF